VVMGRQRGFTMIELLIVMVVLAILTAIGLPMFLGQRDKAKDAHTRSGVHTIEVGITSYAVDHGSVYPAAVDSKADLVDLDGAPYVDPWPENPWTDTAMESDPSAKGDYTYTRTNDGFMLAGHLSSGEFVVP
jgi:prepilin-type N-terminal cleavage/methylation domain-containing protein